MYRIKRLVHCFFVTLRCCVMERESDGLGFACGYRAAFLRSCKVMSFLAWLQDVRAMQVKHQQLSTRSSSEAYTGRELAKFYKCT